MTTIFNEDICCSVCNNKSSHSMIGSTNTFGSPDLDTRPAEMQRSTINHWVQRCPSCGYCAPDISSCEAGTKEIVYSKAYQDILLSNKNIELVSSFLAVSFEREQLTQFDKSAWAAIHAAWIADDAQDFELAIHCRKEAIRIILLGASKGQRLVTEENVSEVITVDLMRRAGMLQEAIELAKKVKTNNIEKILMQIIEFQINLISQKDTLVHTITESTIK